LSRTRSINITSGYSPKKENKIGIYNPSGYMAMARHFLRNTEEGPTVRCAPGPASSLNGPGFANYNVEKSIKRQLL
jgi:hypothetical protein